MFPGEFAENPADDFRLKNPLSEKPCPLCGGMMGWPEDEVVSVYDWCDECVGAASKLVYSRDELGNNFRSRLANSRPISKMIKAECFKQNGDPNVSK
jgi:hypothetical protein